MRKQRRWSDKQLRLFPFLLAWNNWKKFGVILDTGADENLGLHLRIYFWTLTLIVELPQLIQPWRRKIAAHWDQATVERLGRDWYYDEQPREFGFCLNSDGFLRVFLGPQTGDSVTTKDWSCHLPWTQWRFIRHSLYGLDGEHFWTELESARPRGIDAYKPFHDAKERVPKRNFDLWDYDGKYVIATTHIDEMEWHFGEGWFKWLSFFRAPKIVRSLNISFNNEVGPEKGSWKGGLCGTSINMQPGELHESAFRRFCREEHRSKNGQFKLKYHGINLNADTAKAAQQ